jgi:RNA polymerase sigma-70 factor (ECF subfamily)
MDRKSMGATPEAELSSRQDFERAYRTLAPGARRAAVRVLGDHAAAEDVVQDVFMDLWERPEAYDSRRGPLSSYVVMIARARAIDRWRSSRARGRASERVAQETERAAAQESAADGAIRRERARQVLRALGRLPRSQREALLLTGSGLGHKEIASATGAPLGTVKGRVRLGLKRTRALLAS